MGKGVVEYEETDVMLDAIKEAFTTAVKERTRLENSFLHSGGLKRLTLNYVNFDAALRLLINLTRYDTTLDTQTVNDTLELIHNSKVPSSKKDLIPIFDAMDQYLALLFKKRVLNYKGGQT